MANLTTEAKTSYCTRSISLPSRSRPLTASLEEHLGRLRSLGTASTSSSSAFENLGLLIDLFESFDDFLQLPQTRQVLSQCQQGQWVEQSLDGSLRLLDICGMSKDALLMMKESLRKLDSSVRRRKIGESGSTNEVRNFLVAKKNAERIVNKCFKILNKMQNCKIEASAANPNHAALLSVLREVEAVTLPILRSILSHAFRTDIAKSRISGKSLFSKFMPSKQIAYEGELMNRIAQALEGLEGQKTDKVELQAIESIIQELEEGLEFLFRRLLKSRVSLLNIFN